MRVLIQTRNPLAELGDADIAEFDAAITAQEQTHQRTFKHYRTALHATRGVLYHLDGQVTADREEHRASALAVAAPLRRCLNRVG